MPATACLVVMLLVSMPTMAGIVAAPGDSLLRHDLQLLNDSGAMNVPLTTWPVAWDDVRRALDGTNSRDLTVAELDAFARIKRRLDLEAGIGTPLYRLSVSGASNPLLIRSFEDTPRTNGEVRVRAQWTGNRFALNLSASQTSNPSDGDNTRADDTHVGIALGNWLLFAGWQERWWGPGRDGSLILSGNARPLPALSVQRNHSQAFESRWLRWIGPWTLHAFIGLLDDERVVDDALLFGMRASFRPLQSLEIGLSRTAQFCGSDRPCDASTFADLLVGNDNRGVNVNPDDEPGNQLAGVDIRWRLPGRLPLAIYAQWIGEDTRRGGPQIGSWLRQAGIEHWGAIAGLQHRTHIEVADTSCRAGGFGLSEVEPDCAYEHSIYRTGYRYNGRPLAHGIDGDGLSYSFGVTLVQSSGHGWSATVRHMDINRVGQASTTHTLSAVPQDRLDVQLSHRRELAWGTVRAGLGYRRIDDVSSGEKSDVTGFIQWSTP